MELFRDVITSVVDKLRAKFKNQKRNCCFVWLTILSPDYPEGINLGGICLFKSKDLLLIRKFVRRIKIVYGRIFKIAANLWTFSFNPVEEIINDFLVAAYVSFSSNTTLPLDNK